MLGLILLYFIGRWHFNLAEKYNKSKWGFAILGVVTYYVGIIIGGLLIGIIAVAFDMTSILELPDVVLGLMALPIGLLATWGLHTGLRKSWEKNTEPSEVLDDSLNLDA